MSFEEKNAWIMGLVTVAAYACYLVVILGRAQGIPITAVPYVATMVWTIVLAIVASVLLIILVSIAAPREAGKKDQRDKQIHQHGEYVGQSFVVIGGLVAMVLAMAEARHFWIANVIYLGFVLSAILGSATKIVAYRRGFQS